MLANGNNGAGLRSLFTFSRMEGEADLLADRQLLETTIGNGIAMEVDLRAIGRGDEAVVLFGDETGNPAMQGNIVRLHVPAPAPDIVLELAPHGVEAVAHRDVDVLVGMVLGRIALHHDFLAGDLEVDPDVKEIAMPAPVRRFDNDAAAHDAIEELLELPGALADFR